MKHRVRRPQSPTPRHVQERVAKVLKIEKRVKHAFDQIEVFSSVPLHGVLANEDLRRGASLERVRALWDKVNDYVWLATRSQEFAGMFGEEYALQAFGLTKAQMQVFVDFALDELYATRRRKQGR